MGDWLTILIILIIIAILLDGWRRMRNAQKDSLKVPRNMGRSASRASAPEAARKDYSAELPNGGARVVGYRETPEDERPFKRASTPPETDPDDFGDDDFVDEDGRILDDELQDDEFRDDDLREEDGEQVDAGEDIEFGEEYDDVERPETTAPERGRIPEQVALNLDESVPILMETTGEDEMGSDDDRIEPTLGGREAPPVPKAQAPKPQSPKPRTPEPSQVKSTPRKPVEQAAHKPAPKAKAEPKREPKPAPKPEEVLVVNVMAPSGQQFRGDALLDAMLEAGLRYGDMNIFHRYEGPKGGGAILFSLANMVKPGTFDLDGMDSFTTPGVSLFMTLPLEADVELANVEVFDEMLEAARAIALALGGELKDENRSVMTRQTQEHCRQRIHEFERKQLSRAPH